MIIYLVLYKDDSERPAYVIYGTEIKENAYRLYNFFQLEYGDHIHIREINYTKTTEDEFRLTERDIH